MNRIFRSVRLRVQQTIFFFFVKLSFFRRPALAINQDSRQRKKTWADILQSNEQYASSVLEHSEEDLSHILAFNELVSVYYIRLLAVILSLTLVLFISGATYKKRSSILLEKYESVSVLGVFSVYCRRDFLCSWTRNGMSARYTNDTPYFNWERVREQLGWLNKCL